MTSVSLDETGASARRETRRDWTGSSALAPAAHGGLPPERYPGHRPSRRPPSRPRARPARVRPSSRRSSIEPAKITVKSARYARVAGAMALRATHDCDLARIRSAPIGWMVRTRLQTVQQEGQPPLSAVLYRGSE